MPGQAGHDKVIGRLKNEMVTPQQVRGDKAIASVYADPAPERRPG